MITVLNHQKDLFINKSSVRALVVETLRFLKISYSEVAIYFVSEDEIKKLHEEFFDDPTTTDCISFPMDEEILGEVFVCPKTAIEYAKKRDLDPYEETTLYIIHGLLHLIGYDDLEEKERRVMRKKEKSCMHHLYSQKKILAAK